MVCVSEGVCVEAGVSATRPGSAASSLCITHIETHRECLQETISRLL